MGAFGGGFDDGHDGVVICRGEGKFGDQIDFYAFPACLKDGKRL